MFFSIIRWGFQDQMLLCRPVGFWCRGWQSITIKTESAESACSVSQSVHGARLSVIKTSKQKESWLDFEGASACVSDVTGHLCWCCVFRSRSATSGSSTQRVTLQSPPQPPPSPRYLGSLEFSCYSRASRQRPGQRLQRPPRFQRGEMFDKISGSPQWLEFTIERESVWQSIWVK